MKTLFQAIYATYEASDLAASLTGLYNTQAPADAVFPYSVYTLVSNVQDFTFTENFEDCLVQFSLFSDVMSDSTQVCDLFELLKTAFDFLLDLGVAGYATISIVREIANLIKEKNVWHYAVTYRILLQED